MSEAFLYHTFAKSYGWTPQQTDSVPEVLLWELQLILDEVSREEEREMKRARSR